MPEPAIEPVSSGRWKVFMGLAPAILLWGVLVAWVAYLLYDRTDWWSRADQANLREWLDESRVFRKSLPELVRDYVREHRKGRTEVVENSSDVPLRSDELREQIRQQLAAMVDPTRIYQGYLPLFPEIYCIKVSCVDDGIEPIKLTTPVPRPQHEGQVQKLSKPHPIYDGEEVIGYISIEYRLHAFSKTQREEAKRAQTGWAVGALVLGGGIAALIWVYLFLVRERQRELHQIIVQQEKEHTEKLLLEEQLRVREAEHAREELDRKLLQQRLEASRQEKRAAEAERAALELKSQLYASIGIMAGSYAHNIKNLLVRPNDLLARCLEADQLSAPQASMLQEVRSTLGTVTERLQQILRTVKRDPSQTEMTRLDLNELVRDTLYTWAEMGREKWKLNLTLEATDQPLWVHGDLSHLQQAIENLIFNARDATFEMRNHLREVARTDPNHTPEARRRAVLEAAAWKGEVRLRTRQVEGAVILEVSDNGIGMSEEVRRRCTQTHFTTKRDNALYEGLSAGMGLGLSFVAVVLEHHGAHLEIDSAPLQGATFRLRFPQQ